MALARKTVSQWESDRELVVGGGTKIRQYKDIKNRKVQRKQASIWGYAVFPKYQFNAWCVCAQEQTILPAVTPLSSTSGLFRGETFFYTHAHTSTLLLLSFLWQALYHSCRYSLLTVYFHKETSLIHWFWHAHTHGAPGCPHLQRKTRWKKHSCSRLFYVKSAVCSTWLYCPI